MIRPEDPNVDLHTSEPGPLGQYLMRVYRGNGPVVRTVCWRQSPQDTWGPEHVLFAVSSQAVMGR